MEMKEELLKKIRALVEGEKLALDSYFFCGSCSSLPDEELISSGEAYLRAAESGSTDEAAKEKLLERLESAAGKKQEVLKSRASIVDDMEDPKAEVIREILENRELL